MLVNMTEALSGAPLTIGRESREDFEPHAGRIFSSRLEHFH